MISSILISLHKVLVPAARIFLSRSMKTLRVVFCVFSLHFFGLFIKLSYWRFSKEFKYVEKDVVTMPVFTSSTVYLLTLTIRTLRCPKTPVQFWGSFGIRLIPVKKFGRSRRYFLNYAHGYCKERATWWNYLLLVTCSLPFLAVSKKVGLSYSSIWKIVSMCHFVQIQSIYNYQ